jgi:hypothetical protein
MVCIAVLSTTEVAGACAGATADVSAMRRYACGNVCGMEFVLVHITNPQGTETDCRQGVDMYSVVLSV